ncbi:hypothetical protein AAC387_Pa07g1725 [Persea americana]
MGMKGGIGYTRLRCKWLSLTLTALICTAILLWQWEKTPLFTVLSPQNQLEILSPVVANGVQTLDHEADNEENVKIKAVEKETKAEQGCNYAKSQWVADRRRPLYSGFDCQQ